MTLPETSELLDRYKTYLLETNGGLDFWNVIVLLVAIVICLSLVSAARRKESAFGFRLIESLGAVLAALLVLWIILTALIFGFGRNLFLPNSPGPTSTTMASRMNCGASITRASPIRQRVPRARRCKVRCV